VLIAVTDKHDGNNVQTWETAGGGFPHISSPFIPYENKEDKNRREDENIQNITLKTKISYLKNIILT
jgi:hypothetical protein